MIQLPGISWVRLATYAAVVLAIYGAGVYTEHGRMQKKLDKAVAAHNQFKGGVAALGQEAIARNAKIALDDLKRKERTDEENTRRARAHDALVRGLRADADRARSGFLSAVGTATRSTEEAEKFRAKFERAYRELVQEVRGVGDDGDAAVRDLDSAKDWTQRRE